MTVNMRFPSPLGLAAWALAAFAVVTVDTLLRGPLSSGVQAANDAVARSMTSGFPAHAIGRELSKLGDFVVLVPVLALAAGLLVGARRYRTAAALLGAALLGPLCVGLLQPALSPLNRPIEGLDPSLIPDTQGPARQGGEHLFPSGHATEAALGWGLFLFLAVPTAVPVRGGRAARRLRLGLALAWTAVVALAALGRILRQAHGYNDVLAGWALGGALVAAAVWAVRRFVAPRDDSGPAAQ